MWHQLYKLISGILTKTIDNDHDVPSGLEHYDMKAFRKVRLKKTMVPHYVQYQIGDVCIRTWPWLSPCKLRHIEQLLLQWGRPAHHGQVPRPRPDWGRHGPSRSWRRGQKKPTSFGHYDTRIRTCPRSWSEVKRYARKLLSPSFQWKVPCCSYAGYVSKIDDLKTLEIVTLIHRSLNIGTCQINPQISNYLLTWHFSKTTKKKENKSWKSKWKFLNDLLKKNFQITSK